MSCQASVLFTSTLCKLMFRSAFSNQIKKIIFLRTLFCSWMSQTLTNVGPVYTHLDTRGRGRLYYCRLQRNEQSGKHQVLPPGAVLPLTGYLFVSSSHFHTEFIWFTVYQLPLWSIVKCRCSNLKIGNDNLTGLERNGKFTNRRRKSFKNLWSPLECRLL